MTKDQHIEQENENFENAKKEQIDSWISNGATATDAAQLWDDMVNDPYHADEDMETHFDPTIDDRIARYSPKKQSK